jgi:LytS/YehU family sensor histidine kinase
MKNIRKNLPFWLNENGPIIKEYSKVKFQEFSVWIHSLSWGKFFLFLFLFGVISDALRDMLVPHILHNFFSNLTTLFIFLSFGLKVFAKTKIEAEIRVKTAETNAETEMLKRQLVEAKIQVMQAQIEPHFLFNTLSSLHFLIEQDPKKAEKMLLNLTTYLRYSLPQSRENKPFNTLGKELENIHAYLDIMEIRMGDRLKVEYQVSDELKDFHFPTMMLQPIVENAIKYGIEESIDGGSIIIAANKIDNLLEVSVIDTGIGLENSKNHGNGMALNNIKGRLEMLYDHKAELILSPNYPSGVVAKIVIPLK